MTGAPGLVLDPSMIGQRAPWMAFGCRPVIYATNYKNAPAPLPGGGVGVSTGAVVT